MLDAYIFLKRTTLITGLLFLLWFFFGQELGINFLAMIDLMVFSVALAYTIVLWEEET